MRPKVSFWSSVFTFILGNQNRTVSPPYAKAFQRSYRNPGNLNAMNVMWKGVRETNVSWDFLEVANCEGADARHVVIFWSLALLLAGCTPLALTLAFVYITLPVCGLMSSVYVYSVLAWISSVSQALSVKLIQLRLYFYSSGGFNIGLTTKTCFWCSYEATDFLECRRMDFAPLTTFSNSPLTPPDVTQLIYSLDLF